VTARCPPRLIARETGSLALDRRIRESAWTIAVHESQSEAQDGSGEWAPDPKSVSRRNTPGPHAPIAAS
jgi:hypothetical protein